MRKLSGLDSFGAMAHNNLNGVQDRTVFVSYRVYVFCFQSVMALVCYGFWMDIVSFLFSSLFLCFWPCRTFLARAATAAISLYHPVCLGDI